MTRCPKLWLVTGGLGFIGSAFTRLVLRERRDTEVINLDAMSYAGNPENLMCAAEDPRYQFVKGDIRDRATVRRAFAAGVDAVINFAAETHVDRSILDPAAFLQTNLFGVHNLLEAAREFGVARFLQVSTDEVYGEVLEGYASEGAALRPRSPYAASKAAAELEALAYWNTYGTPVLITRGSNTYGPRQYPEKFIPLFISLLLDDRPVPLYGDGLQVRDWLHVDDHARGILRVLESGAAGNAYNLAGGNLRTNLEITNTLIRECGREPRTHLRHVLDRAGHDRRYAADASKARRLGWEPREPFDGGLQQTIRWYRENEAWWRPLKSPDFAKYYARQYAHR